MQNNNRNNKRLRRKVRKRNIRRYNDRYLRYNRIYRTKPTTFGPGSQFIILSKLVAIQTDTVQSYSLSNILNNKEWSKVENDFMFFKIDRIALIFLPRVYPVGGNQDCLYVNINFTAKQIEVPSLQDNTQMIPPYLPYPKTLLYKVPHVCVDGIVLNAWLDHGDFTEMTDKITFTMSSPDNATAWNFRLEVGVICRLPTNPEDNSKYVKQYIGGAGPKLRNEDEQKVVIDKENKIRRINSI